MVTKEPEEMAAPADWFLASLIEVSRTFAPPLSTVKAWPPTEMLVDPGIAALSALTSVR